MALPQPTAPFTAEDYLRWEAGQPDKHEYYHGETFAMGGASRRHVTISGNVFSALDEALEGSPCRTYMADMKVQAAADEAYFYPDVLVTCDPADHRADQRGEQDRREDPGQPGPCAQRGQQLEVAVAHAFLAGELLEHPVHRPQADVARHRAQQGGLLADVKILHRGHQAQPQQGQGQLVGQ